MRQKKEIRNRRNIDGTRERGGNKQRKKKKRNQQTKGEGVMNFIKKSSSK